MSFPSNLRAAASCIEWLSVFASNVKTSSETDHLPQRQPHDKMPKSIFRLGHFETMVNLASAKSNPLKIPSCHATWMSVCSPPHCRERRKKKAPKESVLTPTGFPFWARTWISNRALLLASWCLVRVCVCVFARPTPHVWRLDKDSWLCIFIFFCKAFGDRRQACVCVNVFCVVHLKKKNIIHIHFVHYHLSVCARVCVCVAEQDPGCHSAERWQSWWSCAARLCCCKQRGDLEEKVFFFAINDKAGRYIRFCVVHLCRGRRLGREYPHSDCTWKRGASALPAF